MHAMQTEIFKRLGSLPKRDASFVQPMECLSVSKLPEDSRWLWEILCGPPHKISVAFSVMWCGAWDASQEDAGPPPMPHNSNQRLGFRGIPGIAWPATSIGLSPVAPHPGGIPQCL